MASSWGVPRSMAEVHALLFIAARPMNADEVMAELGISRGNASMTIRTLLEWGIVHRSENSESRKDFFTAEQDVLTLFATVVRVRKRQEIDPLLRLVEECRAASAACPCSAEDARAVEENRSLNRKLDDIQIFVKSIDALTERYLVTNGSGMMALFQALGEFS